MEWQALVAALQILLLTVAWVLFQKARADLSARAAEAPVLTEMRALQRNVKQLLEDMERSADQQADRLEARCNEARQMLEVLEATRLQGPVEAAPSWLEPTTGETHRRHPSDLPTPSAPRPRKRRRGDLMLAEGDTQRALPASTAVVSAGRSLASVSPRERLYAAIYTRADAGQQAVEIARAVGISEGEVETLLGLRANRT